MKKLLIAVSVMLAIGLLATAATTVGTAHAQGQGGECHLNQGSFGCTGHQDFFGLFGNTICNRNGCHSTGGG